MLTTLRSVSLRSLTTRPRLAMLLTLAVTVGLVTHASSARRDAVHEPASAIMFR